jgi:dihydropteroate synthase
VILGPSRTLRVDPVDRPAFRSWPGVREAPGGDESPVRWDFGRHCFEWSSAPLTPFVAAEQPVLMGVVNVTPDSFSDGGRFSGVEAVVRHALRLVEEGAGIIDIGGESSRPGAEPVSAADECARVLPVIEALRARSAVCISVDTVKASVADAALAAGADVINDITALSGDPEMAAVAAAHGAGVVIMHMRGRPATMQDGDLRSADLVGEVVGYLAERLEAACAAGISRAAICLDPGIGFGKTVEQNLSLIAELHRLHALGRPVLVGASRKAFLGRLTGRAVDARDHATSAASACAVWQGAQIIRVHAVAEARDAVRVAAALRSMVSAGDGLGASAGILPSAALGSMPSEAAR